MRQGIDVESKADVFFAGGEDAFATADAGVVDQDGWGANLAANLGGGGGEGGGGGYVAFEVGYVGSCGLVRYYDEEVEDGEERDIHTTLKSHRNNIKHNDFRSPFSK